MLQVKLVASASLCTNTSSYIRHRMYTCSQSGMTCRATSKYFTCSQSGVTGLAVSSHIFIIIHVFCYMLYQGRIRTGAIAYGW